jgi:hypothetical protein
MIVYDFYSGTGSSTQAFKDAGHTVISFELDSAFNATENVDVMKLNAKDLIEKYGQPDFIWASPPCTAFSVASIGHHWTGGSKAYIPKTEMAVLSQELVKHTIKLIEELAPKGFLIENPRGMLRKLNIMDELERRTVTYCQYGDNRMKPTDLWGTVPNWNPRAMCRRNGDCHVAAPRGSSTGTQGLKGAKDRSRVPYDLSKELLEVLEGNLLINRADILALESYENLGGQDE